MGRVSRLPEGRNLSRSAEAGKQWGKVAARGRYAIGRSKRPTPPCPPPARGGGPGGGGGHAEPVIGPAEGRTRWLCPPYGASIRPDRAPGVHLLHPLRPVPTLQQREIALKMQHPCF